MLLLSGFELYSRWVPLFLLRTILLLNDRGTNDLSGKLLKNCHDYKRKHPSIVLEAVSFFFACLRAQLVELWTDIVEVMGLDHAV